MSRPAMVDFQAKSGRVLTFGAMQYELLTQTNGVPTSYPTVESHATYISLLSPWGRCAFRQDLFLPERAVLASSVKSLLRQPSLQIQISFANTKACSQRFLLF